MKIRTRLTITFLAIILLPIILTIIAFLGIGATIAQYNQSDFKIRTEYSIVDGAVDSFAYMSDLMYGQVKADLEENPLILEDKNYLTEANKRVEKQSSYIIVRKNNVLYFTGNPSGSEKLFTSLPEYGFENTDSAGYYYWGMQKLVQQIDFKFSDGSDGSFFIVTRVGTLISRTLLIDMLIAIIVILIFTSICLTRWIYKGIFTPIRELNKAMQNIAEGSFDYILATNSKGEVGELYKNYEDMRLHLKESAEEKIHNERQNRELVSNISHDLKTPITAIKGYVEGIMDGVADTPEKVDKYIHTVYNKAIEMDRLINELTLYSGIDANRIPYNFHKINVADYFGDCIEEVGVELESKNIELNYTNIVSPDTVIIADPEQLKRVINNIIGNSMKYLDKKQGVIDIRILDAVDSVRFEIEDNGKGIAAKDLGNIFERFYRTDASRNSVTGGSGIGLSIVKKIIEDHGGYIWATSKEGEGTCLHFVIRKYKEVEENE